MADKIAEAYVDISVKTAAYKKQLSGLETATKKTTQSIQQRFKTLAPTFRKVGIGLAVAGGAITAALGLTIKSAMSFNKEMANIATLIPGATKRVLELKGAIRSMAVTVGKDTADLAQGAYQVISAFGDTADTVAILEIAAKAATAGVADTTSAINLLSAVTKGYGDTSKEAVQKASDLAFMTVKLGQTNFPQLEASIGRVIPLTAEMGVSQEELFAVMATGTGVTGKAAEVATQFRGVIQSLMSPTADMTKLFKEKGYASGKAMLADLGLAESLKLIKSTADATKIPLQKYISSIEGQTLALALTGTQADTYTEKLAAMMDVTDQTNIAFKEQTEGINKAGFAFEQAKIRIGVLGQEIGDRLLPMITPLIEKVTDLVKKMSDWAKEHPKLSQNIVKFAAVLGPLLLGLGALMMVLPGIVAIAPAVGAAFHIMLGPVGLITAAIAAAVAAFLYFYKTSDKFRGFVDKIVAHIKAFVQNAWNRLIWLKDNWGKLWKTIFEGLPKIAKNNFNNVITIFKWVWDFIKGWGNWLGKNFINVWKNMFSAITTAVKNFGDNIWQQLKWIGEKMKPQNWFKKIERPDWTPLLEGFEAVWEEMPKIAELQLKKMTEGVKVYFEPLPELVEPFFAAVEEGAEGASDAIDTITTATDKYITTFDALLKLRSKDKELTEEEKKRIKELEEAQKAAQEEIKKIRATSFEEWQAQNEARTKELYAELDKQKKIQKDAKDEIASIRKMSFEDWQKKNEARTKELYNELATQKQIQEDAKSEIADIRKMSFEDWQKKNEARVKELEDALKERKKAQQDAQDEIADIRTESFEDWKAKNEARTKELYDELAIQKQIEQNAKDEIATIRAMSFEEWKAKNEARTKELYAELAIQKQIEQDAKNEIAAIRTMSFKEWQKQNEARTKELEDELAKQKQAEQDAADEVKALWESSLRDITSAFETSISNWIKEGLTFQNFFTRLTQKLADAWIDNFVKELLKTDAIKGVLNTITGLMGTLTAAIVKAAIAAWDFAVTGITKLIGGLASLATGVWSAITAVLAFVVATIKAIAVMVYKTFAWIPFVGPILGIAAAAAAIAAIYGLFAGITSAQKGIPYVPEDMPVMVHRKEAILTAPQAEEWRAGRGEAGITTGNIFINLPGVKDVAGFKRLRPTEWKRHLDSGLIEGMRMVAKEGKLSKESVMID